MKEPYWRYWGKARPQELSIATWHPLIYHCLDVAAVAEVWWNNSPVIRHHISGNASQNQARAWMLFFLAIHDLGKIDARFQAKVPELYGRWHVGARVPSTGDIQDYRHGPAGFAWFVAERNALLGRCPSYHALVAWHAWLAAVTGHHGRIPPYGDDALTSVRGLPKEDRLARQALFQTLEDLFLKPSELSLADDPPALDEGSRAFLAGFCSVCDWLGSNDAPGQFEYFVEETELEVYFRQHLPIAQRALELAQLHQPVLQTGGFAALYAPDKSPRQVQTLVDGLPLEAGLTLMEAPTGSGKTEAALAQAARLMSAGLAEGVIFALPTQATANAMLARLEQAAPRLFPHGSNLILAHGRDRYNPHFDALKAGAAISTVQGGESATVHCATWLASSRKRAFLGQLGVCTVDQVLLAVLPVRHAFIRGFGLGKNVLIVDEVHAYDSYMLGLLCEVLARQRQAGGSAILLSATLPSSQREMLLQAWNDHADLQAAGQDYPLVTCVPADGQVHRYTVTETDRPSPRAVAVGLHTAENMRPDAGLTERILDAARAGAKVAVICNLVADAQTLAQALRQQSGDIPVDIFHSRYRFLDRQEKESAVLSQYGEERPEGGRILVATQVVEQSLDLDFDWLITQLCPMDLLFQRLGRLHRHVRSSRPSGFETPSTTVLIPPDSRYGHAQEKVYCKAILWRTEWLLKRNPRVEFPDAYRPFIEKVYEPSPWPEEPETFTKALDEHLGEAMAQRNQAILLARATINPFDDEDEKIRAFTRSGEQGPQVLLATADGKAPLFRPEATLAALPEWDLREVLDLESVIVPNGWRGALPQAEGNRIVLTMCEIEAGRYVAETAKARFVYERDLGLRKVPTSVGNVP